MKMDDIDLIYRVMPEHEAINARLENWAHWSKDRMIYRSCASLEGRYTSPQNDDDRQPRLIFDVQDALRMHRAICRMPEKHRKMLHMWYIHKPPVFKIRRLLGLTREGAEKMLMDARQMAINLSKAY